MFKIVVVVFASVAIFGIVCKDLPPNFKKCQRGPNFDNCLKDAIQDSLAKLTNGLPDFKMPPVDPLEVESMTIGAGKGPVQVVQKFKNVKIHGITKAKINEVKTNINDTDVAVEVDASVEQLLFNADYDLNGKILILPVVGTGKCSIALNKVNTHFTLSGKIKENENSDGKKYATITELAVSIRPTNVHYNFENLFNGDQKLGDQINTVLNGNSKEVFDDVGSGYEEFLGIVIKTIANQIFTQVPFDELFAPQS